MDRNEQKINRVKAQALLGRAKSRWRDGDFEAAEADCTAALRLDQKLDDVYRIRGKLRSNLGDYPAAVEDFKTFLRRNPDSRYRDQLMRFLRNHGLRQKRERFDLDRAPLLPTVWNVKTYSG